ncbi:unannotated protein [freshwater metagenome]|uniref:Unannotated protein n=1 Tax=freshwater metagenome TaxID=449393 RepID=A0A6J7LCS5_9ZZZZ
MIARGFERVGKAGKDTFAFVRNKRCLSVHELWRTHNIAAVDLTDALMAKTNTEHRNATSECGDDLVGEAGIFGTTRTRTDEHTIGSEFFDLLDRERVAAMHQRVSPQLAQILDQIEDERVVVIEDKDACGHRPRTLSAGAARA